jgi:hypothetical protein
MKKAKMKIDLVNDKCEIFGQEVELMTTSSGHYCLSLLSDVKVKDDIAWVLAVDLVSLSSEEQFKSMTKLHKQMGHHPKEKFVNLLKDANAWYPVASDHLDKIIDDCEGCLLLKRNPILFLFLLRGKIPRKLSTPSWNTGQGTLVFHQQS